MEHLHQNDPDRMTPEEAEEVLKRFREEEEARQKEMEAQATNPTVADLAEGLGVPNDRVKRLLDQVRGDAVPQPFRPNVITQEEAKVQVERANRSAWLIALVVVAVFLVMAALAMVFSTTEVRVNAPEAQPVIEGAGPTSGTELPPPRELPTVPGSPN